MDIGAGITFGNGVGITKQPPPLSFVGLLGTTTSGYTHVTNDSLGNTFVWASTNYQTPVIAKYDSLGVLQWKKELNGTLIMESSTGCGCDSSGNFYISGQRSTNPIAIGILKISTDGAIVWQTQLTTLQPGCLTVDSSGNTYVTNYLFGAAALLIFKINSSGTIVWQKSLVPTTGTGWNSGGGPPAVDSSGNVYVGGWGTVGSNSIMTLIKLNSSGATVWAKSLAKTGTSYDYQPYSIAVDSNSNVYISHDEGIAKFDSSGNLLFQKGGTAKGNLAVDSSDNLYSVFDTTVSGTNAIAITKHNSSGTLQWARYLGMATGAYTYGATYVDSTSIYISGRRAPYWDCSILFAKLLTDGSISGTYSVGGSPFSTYSTTIGSLSLTPTTPTLTAGTLSITNTNSSISTGTPSYAVSNSSIASTLTSVYAPSAPGAPTIGTATATSYSSATVTFTAPASDGYSTITSYTATSSPGGITGTLSQAGSGTITVNGLNGSTGYTFTVTATNAIGTSSPSASSNSITTPVAPLSYKAIFGYGSGQTNITNLVSNTGVVATDTAGVGTARDNLAAAGYGTDKAIFGYGQNAISPYLRSMTNLVSNTGVVATDTAGVGTARYALAAATYGTDKAIFGYGYVAGTVSMTNLVSNTGTVATDTTGVGTARQKLAAACYGTDKAIFGYGVGTGDTPVYSLTNLVSNTGTVATNTTGVGTARFYLAAAGYGTDKAIFGYGDTGSYVSITNLVSNTGVVASDTTGVGTARAYLAAAGYSTDKAIFGYGYFTSVTNLVTNTGVVGNDVTGVGTTRYALAAASYGGT